MDPLFGNWYNQPDSYRSAYSFGPRTAATRPVQRQPARKVFQVPVTDGSHPVLDRFESALKIQRVFRGFLVRKSLKRITDVKKQVDAIEEKLLRREVVELIRRDERERLRMGESLMSLLLKLDSIRGFDLGVRDCRKAVIKKAIALQERIDDILAAGSFEVSDGDEVEEVVGGEVPGVEVCADERMDCSNRSNMEDFSGEGDGEATDSVVDVGVVSEVKVGETERKAVLGTEDDDIDNWIEVEGVEEVGKGDGGCRVVGVGKESKEDGCQDCDKRSNEMMERLTRDNEKMMSMMTQLFDSNEKQMKMLTALSHRVEMLEKAFICDRQRRKTKQQKRKAAGEEGDRS